MAEREPVTRVFGDVEIEVPEGCVLTSVRSLARRWSWPKTRVERFLKEMLGTALGTPFGTPYPIASTGTYAKPRDTKRDTSTPLGTPFGTVYRVVNYDTYAIPWDTFWDTETLGTGNGTPYPIEKQVTYGDPWDTFWDPPHTAVLLNNTASPPGAHVPARTRARVKAIRLPDSWEPNATHERIAREEGVNMKREVLKFRDHAQANGRTLKDWDAGFRTWLRKASEYATGNNGSLQTGWEEML